MEQETTELNFDLETTHLADYVQTLKFEDTNEHFELNHEIKDLNLEFVPVENDYE